MFTGKVVNVSGWQDADKQGKKYKEYFQNASEYWTTNYKTEARGFQGDIDNEIFLDLTQEVEQNLCGSFDVVFNHTVLEHIFEINIAFQNLCRMTKDIAIVIVPFLQEQHAAYGDYWRFSPQAIDKLFQANDLETIYLNYNDVRKTSIYVFAIGSKHPERWDEIKNHKDNKIDWIYEYNIGTKIIQPNPYEFLLLLLKKVNRKLFK
ncbi:MAG: hypothetical protein ACOCUL_02860 [Bacteroidota bacterium]